MYVQLLHLARDHTALLPNVVIANKKKKAVGVKK